MSTRIGLRSHGLVESRWIPTKGRFVSLEAKDESWAKFFGLGRTVTRPMELYDVRSLSNKLIGYSGQNPADYPHRSMLVHVLDRQVERQCWQEAFESNKAPVVREVVQSIQVMVELVIVGHERFACWYVRIEDAEKLATSSWLKCIGDDRLEEFVWELRRKKYDEAVKASFRSASSNLLSGVWQSDRTG